MITDKPLFQFRLSQMLAAVCLVALLLGAYRLHPALAVVVAYCAALCTVRKWPTSLRMLFIVFTLAGAAIAGAQDAWPLAALLAIFAIAVIEGPITSR